MGCGSLLGHAVGFLSRRSVAMAGALVLPWAPLASVSIRATDTTIEPWPEPWQRHGRWKPVGLAMAVHGKPHGLTWYPPRGHGHGVPLKPNIVHPG